MQSREMFPTFSDKSRAAIRDHVPQLMDTLCDMIETGEHEDPTKLSKIHGQQRHTFHDCTLEQVIKEYWLLKKIIFDDLESIETTNIADLRVINRFFESAATTAAVEFTRLREEELQRVVRHLASSNADLERFAAIAAHDLRSPIATIIGYSDLAVDMAEDDPREAIRKFKTIKDISVRMIGLVDQLLQYSKIGKSKINSKTFSLSNAAEEAMVNLGKYILESKAEIIVDSMPNLTGDPVLFSQLFQNLIANSLKFKSEKRPCKITISARKENGIVKIKVKDNGVGFDPTKNLEIFEPFERGDNIQGIKGSGLGLATVKKILDLHGGYISATGTVEQGAEFTIEVPVN